MLSNFDEHRQQKRDQYFMGYNRFLSDYLPKIPKISNNDNSYSLIASQVPGYSGTLLYTLSYLMPTTDFSDGKQNQRG